MLITAEERVNMFRYSDEEEEEFVGFQTGDKSDLDIVQYSSEKSESEGCNSEEEGEWSEDLENFDLKAFDPSDSRIKVQVLDGSEALFFFTLMLGEDTIDHVIAETNKVAREKLAGNEI